MDRKLIFDDMIKHLFLVLVLGSCVRVTVFAQPEKAIRLANKCDTISKEDFDRLRVKYIGYMERKKRLNIKHMITLVKLSCTFQHLKYDELDEMQRKVRDLYSENYMTKASLMLHCNRVAPYLSLYSETYNLFSSLPKEGLPCNNYFTVRD